MLIVLLLMGLVWLISIIVVWAGFVIWLGPPVAISDMPLMLYATGVLAFLLSTPGATSMTRISLLVVPWLLATGWWVGGF